MTMRGFLIQARRADLGENTNLKVGNFKDIPGTKQVCNRVSGFSQRRGVCLSAYVWSGP